MLPAVTSWSILIVIGSLINLIEISYTDKMPVTNVKLLEFLTTNDLCGLGLNVIVISEFSVLVHHPKLFVLAYTDRDPEFGLSETFDLFPTETEWMSLCNSSSLEDNSLVTKNIYMTACTGYLSSLITVVISEFIRTVSPGGSYS